MKGFKSSSVFANFYYGSYKDDFYILIPIRFLKVGPNKSNTLEQVTPKPGPYRFKDCHWFMVLEGVTIENNGFKDLSFWESIERGLCMSENRFCELVES